MEKHVRQTGIRKGYLIEQAVLHRTTRASSVSQKTGAELLRRTKPTAALHKLMQVEPRVVSLH